MTAPGLSERSGPLDWDCDGAHWPNRSQSRFLDAGGLTWHAQMFGAFGGPSKSPGDSRPKLLLLHGTAASTHSWGGLAPLLEEHFQVLSPDLPGHGFTQLPARAKDLSLTGMSAAVGELITSLDFEPEVVAGHSAGAAILARMSLDGLIAPKVLISLNGALLPFGSLGRYMFPAMARLLFQNSLMPWVFSRQAKQRQNVERLIAGTGSRLKDADLDYYVRLFRCPRHLEAALGMMANWDLPGLERQLPKLSTPLVLVAGSEDQAVSPEKACDVERLVPGSEVVYVRGLGHLAHEEDPVQIASIIRQAAARHGAGAPGAD